MIQRTITYFGQKVIVACDEMCNKAWGINNRPSAQLDENNPNDFKFIPDNELGEAPLDPGTFEGLEMTTKPLVKEDRLNKWCIRECERCVKVDKGEPIVLKDFSKPFYNIPSKHQDNLN